MPNPKFIDIMTSLSEAQMQTLRRRITAIIKGEFGVKSPGVRLIAEKLDDTITPESLKLLGFQHLRVSRSKQGARQWYIHSPSNADIYAYFEDGKLYVTHGRPNFEAGSLLSNHAAIYPAKKMCDIVTCVCAAAQDHAIDRAKSALSLL